MKQWLKHTAVIACLLPLLFLNIKHTHDWGDDFAQYLLEARNIIQHEPLGKSGFTENPNFVLGPNCYPPGFPVILALTAPLTHLDVAALNVLESAFLLLIGYFSFLLFNKWFHFPPSLVLALIIAYNPMCLIAKTEILSDYPFTAVMLLFFLVYLKDDKKPVHYIVAGLLLAFSIEIRVVGWVLFMALLLEAGFKQAIHYYRKKKLDPAYIKHHAYLVASCLGLHYLLFAMFPQHIVYYDNPYALPLFERISLNANYNYAELKYFFSCFDEGFLNTIISYGFVLFALAGMLLFIFKADVRKPTILLFFFLGYILSILIHQYSDTGFRLVIPVVSIVLFFACYALLLLLGFIPYKEYLAFSFGLIVLFCYKDTSRAILVSGNEYPGPYTAEARQAFEYITKNTTGQDLIMFAKPRALTYFTGRRTCINIEWSKRNVIAAELKKFDPDYMLVCSEITDDSTRAYFSGPVNGWETVYVSDNYKLYKNLLNSHR